MSITNSFINHNESLLKKRSYAITIDLLLVSLLAKGIFHTYINFLRSVFAHMPYNTQISLASKLLPLFFIIFTVAFFGYFVLSYYLGEGQTPGKMIFNLKVTTTHDGELTFLDSVRRTLGYFVCYNSALLLFTIPFFRKDERGLPDFVSRTKVTLHTLSVAPEVLSEEKAPDTDFKEAA